MNFDDPDQLMLQGTLILADPSMKDPNFARAVIFLTAHSPAEGAHGFILNRPLGSCVADFLQSEEFSPLAEVPVFLGGPVETGELTFGASWWDKSREEVRFVSHLSKEGAIEAVEQGHSVKAFVGYAGWAGGQLEAELRQRGWITSKMSRNLIEKPQTEELWRCLLRAMGPWHQLLADVPNDLSLN